MDTIADRSISGDKLINGTITFRQVANDALGAMKMDFRGTRGDADVIIRYRPDLGGGAWVWAKADNTIFDTENEVEIGAPLVAAAEGKFRWGRDRFTADIPVAASFAVIPDTHLVVQPGGSDTRTHYIMASLDSPRIPQSAIDVYTHFRVVEKTNAGGMYTGVGANYFGSLIFSLADANLGALDGTQYPDFTNRLDLAYYVAKLGTDTDYVLMEQIGLKTNRVPSYPVKSFDDGAILELFKLY